jgi:hypothetical protein
MGAPFVWFDVTAADGQNYQGRMSDGEQPWAGITPAGAVPAGRWVPT